jgi:hypothetical protein
MRQEGHVTHMEELEMYAALFSKILEVNDNSECSDVNERIILIWSLEIYYV